MKKNKTYKFDRYGFIELQNDIKKEKAEKINGITSAVILVTFAALGLMSKDYFILYVVNKGIDLVTKRLL